MTGLTENPTTKLKTFESTPLTKLLSWTHDLTSCKHNESFLTIQIWQLKKRRKKVGTAWHNQTQKDAGVGGGVSQFIFPSWEETHRATANKNKKSASPQNRKAHLHFVSPRCHFVWIACYFKPLSSFFQSHNGHVGKPLLICRLFYSRHLVRTFRYKH